MKDSTWLRNFRQRMGVSALEDTPTDADATTTETPAPAPTTKTDDNFRGWMIAAAGIVLLFIICLAVWKKNKTQEFSPEAVNNEFQQQPIGQQPIGQQPITQQPLQLPPASNLETRVSTIEGRVNMAFDRLMILGAAVNQNTVVMEYNSPREELVYINTDWTINQLPNHLSGNDVLQKFVKPETSQQ